MQIFKISMLALMAVAFLSFSSPFASLSKEEGASLQSPPRWELLGKRKVNRGVDRDEIRVTVREGRFSKIKIRVLRSPINLHRCVLHFANGETQEVAIRSNLPQGGETRVIDIAGGKRVISKVVFWYDTKGLQNKAVVQLWGRR